MVAAASAIVAFPTTTHAPKIPEAPVAPPARVADDELLLPRLASFAEMGLDEDHTPVWEEARAESFSQFQSFIAGEIWRRTREPEFNAEMAEAELALMRAPSQQALFHLDTVAMGMCFEMQEQAARVGWALCQTFAFRLPLGPIYEGLAQGAMKLARLTPMPREDRVRWEAHEHAALRAMDPRKPDTVAVAGTTPTSRKESLATTYADDPGYQAFLQDMAKVGPEAMAPAVVLGAIHLGIPREELGCIGKSDAYAATREYIGPWIAKFQTMTDAQYAEWVELAHAMFDA